MSKFIEKLCDVGFPIAGPYVDNDNDLFLVSSETGDILKLHDSEDRKPELTVVANSAGVPTSLAFSSKNELYVCDLAHQAILEVKGKEMNELEEFVRQYEDKQFRGPNGLVIDSNDTFYFTDGGPLGETTLQNPKGSVYSISGTGQLLQPLALECLSHPAGLCLSPDETCVYVAETLANRVMRFVQRPPGVFHASVYYQFHGALGPIAVATDIHSRLYVARMDFAKERGGGRGFISILDADGNMIADIPLPAPEVTGIAFGRGSDCFKLYITEASTSSIYVLNVRQALAAHSVQV
eukprot:TRINITY_DN2760_c0_g1::TRINITY_DN2760_c0_g1_i1::g.27522::m.27522 TRINITY_DN2760_c0_g1::TRINITY_DN2760_c0_g1_i1::g.27522  ORF type:complete len:295 (-),score=38.13,sp/Q4L9R6/DRP35_STAHJ/28.57/2e-16,SGL/PF08450.7/1.8e-22,NHL/PF01436.16/9.7e+02,NHL/PF01436.16/0.14,NHL/PF01436.16/0.93,NHL/PF01436.16/21,Arylesterase/PF01731.15/2.1e+02,Arylesterase/PF01731.15/4.4e+02,Arylesterase/PF01731.15/0.068,Arylesterase/PF01731.15/1.2e+02,Str_synth/PF03088.11/2.7e+03,Str_synth/PF03088.11/0.0064,Str_synth/PF03088.